MAAEIGSNSVYKSVDLATGNVIYVGITNDFWRRAAEHMGKKGIVIDPIVGLTNLTRANAKAVEQALIDYHKLSKNGGTLINKINSIAQSNPIYAGAVKNGKEILKKVGYPGF